MLSFQRLYMEFTGLTQAWPRRESDASVRHVLSKRNIRDINTNLPCENTKIDIWYNSNL